MVTKKNELPDFVTPLGVKFQVALVEDIDGESVGETVCEMRIIKISSDQDTRRRWTTLLHEYMHACLDISGVGSVVSEEVEEVIVQTLEHGLEQFFRKHGKNFLAALGEEE